MKKTTIFIALSAAVLSVAGFVATKASTKFTAFAKARFIGITPANATLNSANSRLTSIKGSNVTVWLATKAGLVTVLHTAVTIGNTNTQLYLRP